MMFSIIVDRIDTDKDGFLTERELEVWVGHVGKRYIMDDVMRLWPHYDEDEDGYITFDEYKKSAFGETVEDENKIYDTRHKVTFKDMICRKKKLFAAADLDDDKKLTRDELADFLHPEEAPHMKNMYVEIRMEDMDRNKDKYLSLSEYIEDVWPSDQKKKGEEPEWIPREKSNFPSRDKNGDGKLSSEEFRQWLLPDDHDPFNVEAQHLIHHADSDMDKKLSKEEILQHQDVFVGSRATEFGEYLNRHEEF
jgi:Ca2+-binding EF-hand superfamily protein